MILFLDDNLERIERFIGEHPFGIVARTAREAIEALGYYRELDTVSLDHDLGGESFVDSSRADSGMEVVRWIEQNKPKVKHFIIHSVNPNAAAEMTQRLIAVGYEVERKPWA